MEAIWDFFGVNSFHNPFSPQEAWAEEKEAVAKKKQHVDPKCLDEGILNEVGHSQS